MINQVRQKPLEGITVLDISSNLPGPYCSLLLSKSGARVIKIESPQKGDPAKHLPKFYQALNSAKDIIGLDFKTDDGLQEFYKLVRQADVIIEGARPGVAKKMKVDFDNVTKHNDNIVYCSISGYGQHSDKKDLPAHDINLQGASGLLNMFGKPESTVCPIPIADLTASQRAYSEILLALLCRSSGHPSAQYLDVTMEQSIIEMVDIWKTTQKTTDEITTQLNKSFWTRVLGNKNPLRNYLLHQFSSEPLSSLPHYGVFKCADKKYICIGIVDENHFWRALCKQLKGGLGYFSHSSIKSRIMFKPLIKRLIARQIQKKKQAYWLEEISGLPVSGVEG